MESGVVVVSAEYSACPQMAEVLLRQQLMDKMPVYSATARPKYHFHPFTVMVLSEWGLALPKSAPLLLSSLQRLSPRAVILVGDEAAQQEIRPEVAKIEAPLTTWTIADPLEAETGSVALLREARVTLDQLAYQWCRRLGR